MFPPEALFVWNINELQQILANPTPENLFAASGRLRQLLLDEQPLLHQANRNVREKISFVVTVHPALPDHLNRGLVFSQVADGLSPKMAPPHLSTKALNLDNFLKEPVMEINGQKLTVRDVIKYVANYAGYVHKGTPAAYRFGWLRSWQSEWMPLMCYRNAPR